MNTKLLLQVLLALGCLAMVIGMAEELTGQLWFAPPEGWWRGAMACWMLIVAIRMVYPAHTK